MQNIGEQGVWTFGGFVARAHVLSPGCLTVFADLCNAVLRKATQAPVGFMQLAVHGANVSTVDTVCHC